MARTQAADYEQRREAIVEHAAHLFATTGFRGASVKDLAEACDASKSLIYHYYASKEDILYAVMSSHIDQLVAAVDTAFAAGGTSEEKLRRLMYAFLDAYVDAADRQKVLLNELDRLPDDNRSEIIGKQRGIIKAVAGLIAEVDPELGNDPLRVRAQTMLLFGMINWTSNWYDPKGPLAPRDLADMVLRLVLRAPEGS